MSEPIQLPSDVTTVVDLAARLLQVATKDGARAQHYRVYVESPLCDPISQIYVDHHRQEVTLS